jgi:hypothetical protein
MIFLLVHLFLRIASQLKTALLFTGFEAPKVCAFLDIFPPTNHSLWGLSLK